MKMFLRAMLGLAAVAMTASIARAVSYIGDTQSIMSQCQYSGGQYGYVWTQLVSPSGRNYQDTIFLPTTTATGTHYSNKAFDEVGDWHFQQWSRMTQTSQNIKNQDQIMRVVARTCVISVNVAPASNYGSASGGGTVNIGASVALSATAAAGGYKFDSWTQGASAASGGTIVSTSGRDTTSSTYTFTASTNAALYANFKPPTFRKLNVAVSGGGSVSPSSGTLFFDGTTINATASPAAGYSFAGWSGALSGTSNPASLMMDSDKTITATFNVNYYNVAIATNGTGNGSVPGGGYYAYGTTPTFTATPAAGSFFAGWSGAASGGTNPVGVYVDGNKSLTATFNAFDYAVSTATSPAGLGTVSGGGSFRYNQTATFTAPSVTGYAFTGWSGLGLSGTANPVTLNVTAAGAVTAGYTRNNCTLTTAVSGSGSVTVGGTYPYGTVRSITATPGTGQQFTGWSGAATGTANPINITIDSNKTLTAMFAPISYNVTVTRNGAGTGAVAGGGLYNYGSIATLSATPAMGSYFAGWGGALNGTATPQNLTVDGNKAVTAEFALRTFDVATSTSPAGLGVVAGAGKYAYGQTVTVTAPSVVGYTFTSWSGALTGTKNPDTLVIDGDKSATASYTVNRHRLTTAVSGSGAITEGGEYAYGTVLRITATPAARQRFTGWSGAISGTTNPVEITMDGDKSITATFAANQATVSVTNATYIYDGKLKKLEVSTVPAGLTCAITYAGSTTPPKDAGEYPVVATVDDAAFVGTGSGTLRISRATPQLSWPTPDPITHPTPLSERQLNASSDVPGTYVYTPAPGSVLNPGPAQELSVTLKPTDTRNYTDGTATNRLDVNPAGQVVTVSPARSAISAGGTLIFSAEGGANGYVWGGAVAGSGGSQTVAFPLPGGFEVTAYSPAGGVYKRSNTASASVTVSAVPQTVALTPPSALAEPNRAVTFTVAGGRNGYVWGGCADGAGDAKTLVFATPGTYAVTAYSPAGGAFLQSNTASAQFTVAYAQIINFPPPGSFVLRAAGTNLLATASSGLPVRFTVISGPGSLVGAQYLRFSGLGAILVQADQDGNANYSAAPPVRQIVQVNAPPATTLQFPASKTGLIHADHQDTNLALPQIK